MTQDQAPQKAITKTESFKSTKSIKQTQRLKSPPKANKIQCHNDPSKSPVEVRQLFRKNRGIFCCDGFRTLLFLVLFLVLSYFLLFAPS